MTGKQPPKKPETAVPADPSLEDTRQTEMLMAGLSLDDTAHRKKLQDEKEKREKPRTLDDMRRLSEHIKSVPVYKGK